MALCGNAKGHGDEPRPMRQNEQQLQGSIVTLRPSTLDDRRAVWEWGDRSDISPWTSLPPKRPGTYAEFREGWRDHYFDGSNPRLGRVFIIEVEQQAVGMVAHNDIDDQDARAEIDIWMSCEANCGRGYGPDAIMALAEHLKHAFALREVWAQPSARNPRSIRAFEKAGFMRVALPSREAFLEYGPRDYEDSVIMVKQL